MPTKKKFEFSKLLLIQESILIWFVTISLVALAFICILKGYLGTLPWLAAMVGFPWSAYGVSQAFYYNKSKAENTSGGIVYETTVQTIPSAAPPPIEPVSAPINYVPNIDGGI